VLTLFVVLVLAAIIYLHGTVTDIITVIGLAVPILAVLLGVNQVGSALNGHLTTHEALTQAALDASKQAALAATTAQAVVAGVVSSIPMPPAPAPRPAQSG
jgi:hypothetical protein